MLNVRPAHPGDAAGIASVHVASWRETYAGIVSDDFLANLKVERREAMWTEALGQGGTNGNGIFVAETAAGEIVGFASGGKNRSTDLAYSGELYAIYLLRRYQGQGVGRRLFDAVARDLVRDGHETMMLWVLEDNPAVAFYKRLGGAPAASKVEAIGGNPLTELALGWATLGRWAHP